MSGTAVFSHALIAYDRYRRLARPYLPKMEANLVKKMIMFSWIVPAFIASPYLFMFEVQDHGSRIICTPNAIPIKWLDKLYEAVEYCHCSTNTILHFMFVLLSRDTDNAGKNSCGGSR